MAQTLLYTNELKLKVNSKGSDISKFYFRFIKKSTHQLSFNFNYKIIKPFVLEIETR